MVLMFQKEVAERIVAEPGTKAYGRLAVLAQWRTRPRIAVHAEAAKPSRRRPRLPRRSSSSRRIEQPSPACSVTDAGPGDGGGLRPAAQDAAPEPALAAAEPEPLLEAAGIAPTLRGEVLTVRDFARLAYVFERWAPARR